MGTQEVKVMVAMEATKPAKSFKSCALTQGSHHLKAISPLASTVDASSNLYHPMSGDELSLPMVPKGENVSKVKDLELARKRKESSANEAASEDRLRNAGDVASSRATVRIEDSLAETDRSNQDFSTKKQRLDPVFLNGVAQSGDGLYCGVDTNPALRDSETDFVETKNLQVKLDPCGTQSLRIQEDHHERKEVRKHPSEKLDKKLRKEKDKEMLREIANELIRENSKLTNRLLLISEKCQEINEENDLLMDELEKQYGPDAICDLRARNPASANPGSNSNGERTKSGDDSTADHKRDTPIIKVD